MNNQLRPELLSFSQAMEEKLKENDHKEHWSKYSLEWLFHRLLQEVAELHNEMNEGMNVAEEAVDVANFAMMIADNYTRYEFVTSKKTYSSFKAERSKAMEDLIKRARIAENQFSEHGEDYLIGELLEAIRELQKGDT